MAKGIVACSVLLGLVAPAAAASPTETRVAITQEVPFSSQELVHALNVRGVAWSRQIRVQLEPGGQILVVADGEPFRVDLEGRVGAAAARVVALALIAEFGTAAATAPGKGEFAIPTRPPSSAPPLGDSASPSPSPSAMAAAAMPAAKTAAPRQWLTFSPIYALDIGNIDGAAHGLGVSLDFRPRRLFRFDVGFSMLAVNYDAFDPTTFNPVRHGDRPVSLRAGVALGGDRLSVSAGPSFTYHRYTANCTESDEAIGAIYGRVRGVYPIGDTIGLTASATYNQKIADSGDVLCFVSGFSGVRFEPTHTNFELSAGIAIGL